MTHPDPKFRPLALLLFGLALATAGRAQQMTPAELSPGAKSPAPNTTATNAPAAALPVANGSDAPPPADPGTLLLHEAFQLADQKQLDAALAKVNASLQAAPKNPKAYALRAAIEVEKKLWDPATKDFQAAIQLDETNPQLKFDLVEVLFMQKKYDAARPGYTALEPDVFMGDLASYKVFLCDLFGGYEDAAARELDAFNRTGENASYYFANAAWLLYHHKKEEARDWLTSASNIYSPHKIELYATSLNDLGYLPLPPPHP